MTEPVASGTMPVASATAELSRSESLHRSARDAAAHSGRKSTLEHLLENGGKLPGAQEPISIRGVAWSAWIDQRMRDEMEMDSSGQSRSLGSLVAALSRQISALFRRELALARAELSEKMREAGSGVALLAAGGMIILIGLFFVVQAAVFGLVALLDIWLPAQVAVWLGPLLVGLATVLIGVALLSRGRNKLSAETLALHHTAQSLREDTALVREHLP